MTAKMKTESKPFLSGVGPVRRQLQAWRRTRKHRERIPENLWQAMAELARAFGVSRVARALRVEYYALKERVQGGEQSPRSKENHASFVELPMPAPTQQSDCLVELEDGLGAKMTLRLAPGSGTEVLSLVQAFWRRQP
jgi:hypothetical protein